MHNFPKIVFFKKLSLKKFPHSLKKRGTGHFFRFTLSNHISIVQIINTLKIMNFTLKSLLKMKIITSIIGLSAGLFFCKSCEYSITTANISSVRVCGSLNSDGCKEDVGIFEELPDTVYVVSRLKNAPEGTEIRYYWYQFLEDDYILLDSVSYTSEKSSELIHSYILTNALPLGKYRVATRVVANNRKAIVKDFEFKIPDGITLHMPRIGSEINEHGRVSKIINEFGPSDDMVYFSSFLYNIPANQEIKIYFKDLRTNKVYKELNVKGGEVEEEVLLLKANLNKGQTHLNPGKHQIIITIEDREFTYEFTVI